MGSGGDGEGREYQPADDFDAHWKQIFFYFIIEQPIPEPEIRD